MKKAPFRFKICLLMTFIVLTLVTVCAICGVFDDCDSAVSRFVTMLWITNTYTYSHWLTSIMKNEKGED